MKLEFILLFAALSGLVAVSLADTNGDGYVEVVPKTGIQPSFRAKFVMPKLFDFQAFSERFDKHYPNAAELVRRGKIYMARAFAVFISAVKYWRKKATKFLKINPRSDWTNEEIEASRNHMLAIQSDTVQHDHYSSPTPAVEAEDVERALADIVEHKDDDPEYAAIAAELLRGGRMRKRRSLEAQTDVDRQRHLSMDELMGGREEEPQVVSPKYKSYVPSNNPSYEPLQVFSEGVDDEKAGEKVEPIDDYEAERIDKQAGTGGYLSSLIKSIDTLFANDAGENPKRKSRDGHIVGGDFDDWTDRGYESATDEDPVDDPVSDEVYLDYRTTGCLLPPKAQRKCGSCYIFSTTTLMEYHHCMQTGNLVSFSEQYALDCGLHQRIDSMNGCQGGSPPYVIAFYANFGLELSVDYPYQARVKTCPYSPKVEPKHMGHTRFEQPENWHIMNAKHLLSPTEIRRVLDKFGPTVISIITNAEFDHYGGGVDTLDCDPKSASGHGMVIIGHGIEDGIEYWLLRNSHGIQFGLQGHYKLAKSYSLKCVLGITYMSGQFSQNKAHKGKAVFDELKKQQLLAHFGITQSNP